MTPASPFDAPQAVAITAPSESHTLPKALVGVALLVGLIGLLYGQIVQWLGHSMDLSTWLEQLPQTLGWWANHLLTVAVFVFCFTHAYLERHGLREYRQPQQLLIGYGMLGLLMYVAMGLLFSKVFFWIYDTFGLWGDGRILGPLLLQLFGLVRFGLEIVLPLWLCLHLFRSQAQDGAGVRLYSATTLALCFALVMAVLNIQLTSVAVQLIGSFADMYSIIGWGELLVLANCMVGALISFAAARQVLPAQVQGFRGGRLLLACVITLLLWLVIAALGAVSLVFLLMSGTVKDEQSMLVLFGLLQLALLWPLSQLGLRWGYGARAA